MTAIKNRLRRPIRDETGKVLIMALVALVLGALLLTPLLGLMSTGLMGGQVYEQKMEELYAADAGVEDAIHWLINGRPEDWGWDEVEVAEGQKWERVLPAKINGKGVIVTIETREDLGDHEYIVTSTALTDSNHGTTVQSYLRAIDFKVIDGCHEYSGPGGFEVGDTYIKGDATVSVNAKVKGNLIVDGDLTMTQGTTSIEGGVSVAGDITLNQGSEITGNVCAGGNLILRNNTGIEGNVFVGGDLEISNNCDIHGYVFVDGDITFANNANSSIWGNVYAYGDITITLGNPNSRIHGAVYATGKITVDPANRVNRITGGIHEYHDSEDWEDDPPDCPEVPVGPTGIHTYDIFGYSG